MFGHIVSDEKNQGQKQNNIDGLFSAPPRGDGNFRDPLEILGSYTHFLFFT